MNILHKEDMYTPLVSVIVPNYNKGIHIDSCINSVLNQSYKNLEIIFIDNFSTDNSIEIIKGINDKRINIIQFNNRGVIASSRNIGIKNSKGQILAFLDSDDYWHENKLLESIKAILKGADITYHDFYIYKNISKSANKIISCRKLFSPIYFSLLNDGNTIINSSVVIRKDMFLKIGCFNEDPNLTGIEDYEAWVRFSKLSEKFTYISKPLGYLFSGDTNTSNSARLTLKSSETLLSMYKNDIENLQIKPNNLYYRILASSYKLRKYKKSLNTFLKLDFLNLEYKYKLKSALIFISAFFFFNYKKIKLFTERKIN
tara:strand:+ start:2920 stop:3864 length:945 start_codon:yes stop_codon:yes gene_type:complete